MASVKRCRRKCAGRPVMKSRGPGHHQPRFSQQVFREKNTSRQILCNNIAFTTWCSSALADRLSWLPSHRNWNDLMIQTRAQFWERYTHITAVSGGGSGSGRQFDMPTHKRRVRGRETDENIVKFMVEWVNKLFWNPHKPVFGPQVQSK